MANIVTTWPKKRTLGSYLSELEKARLAGLYINYRVASIPKQELERCYIVYDGKVRGYNKVIEATYRGPHEVSRVEDDAWAGFWPEGYYIVRDPQWYPVAPRVMRGFRGWKYYD